MNAPGPNYARNQRRRAVKKAAKQLALEADMVDFAQDIADAKEMMVDMHDNGDWGGPLLISDEEADLIRSNRTW